jgi:hypothetical protein
MRCDRACLASAGRAFRCGSPRLGDLQGGPLTPLTQPNLGRQPTPRSVALRMSLHSAASGFDRSKLGIAFAIDATDNEAGNIDNGQILAGPDLHMLVV